MSYPTPESGAHTLNDLIEISRDGEAFYREALTKVSDPEVRTTFNDMLAIRQKLIRDLSIHVAERGETPEQSGTLVGSMHKLYTDLRAHLSSNTDAVYVSQLEAAEDRLLHSFEDALGADHSPQVIAILREYYPLARTAHGRMKLLKDRKVN